ncbi:MAG: trehalose-phosphatase, partial [Arachnia sp.]
MTGSWRAVTTDGESFFSRVSACPQHTLVASDFDGTLAPIVDDPEASRFLPAAAQAFSRLGPALGQLAISTGRGVDAVRRLGEL